MKSTYAVELFAELFGTLPKRRTKPAEVEPPKSDVMVPNWPAEPGDKVVYHVVPRRQDSRWNVKKEGGSRPSSVCDTKDEAIDSARGFAKNLPWSQVVIHNKDGKVAQEYTYGGPPETAKPATDADTKRPTRKLTPEQKSKPTAKVTERMIWHVTPRAEDGKWNVKRQGGQKPTRVLDKKEDALNAARELAKAQKSAQIIVHNKDGKIAEEFKYDA